MFGIGPVEAAAVLLTVAVVLYLVGRILRGLIRLGRR
jgi:hypothetical protein